MNRIAFFLLAALSFSVANLATSRAETLHLVLLGNTASSTRPGAATPSSSSLFGEAVAADLRLVELTIADGLPSRHSLNVLNLSRSGPSSRHQIMVALRRLPINPGDSVLVYYSGHGGYMTNEDREQVFDFSNAGVGIPEVLVRRHQIVESLARNPGTIRVLAVVSDCCFSRMPTVGEAAYRYGPIIAIRPPTDLIENLFFSYHGSVHLTSSRPDQVSYFRDEPGRPGGLFTSAFASALTENRANRLSWDDFFSKLRIQTSKEFEELCASAGARGDTIPANYMSGIRQLTQTAYIMRTSTLGRNSPEGRLGVFLTDSATIRSVRNGSAAARAGLARNDRLYEVNGHRITQPNAKGKSEAAIRYAPLDSTFKVIRQSISGQGELKEVAVKFDF